MPTKSGRAEEDVIGALPFSDVNGLLSASAAAEKQQAVVARIFPVLSHTGSSSRADTLAQLVALRNHVAAYIDEKVADATGGSYIWHKEGPSVSVNQGSLQATARSNPHLVFHLRTGGECIDDEWFATYLLLEISKRLAEHQLVISVENEDGQFLLVEAAAQLPSWITPENATNRVWIYDGQLHLVTPHLLSDEEDAIDELTAVTKVRDAGVLTRAPEEVETVALARLQEYPRAAADNHHQTLAYLPCAVAQLLTAKPQLVSTCISAIQSRDVMSSRASAKMTHFPPPSDNSQDSTSSASNQTIILTPVRMTRHLYAQLSYDRFFPPRQLGRTWQAAVEKYRRRLHQTPRSVPESQDAEMHEGRWRDLGAKIWCGMEMAYDESLSRQRRAGDRVTNKAMSDSEHDRFLSALQKMGYFGDETRGSALWKTLEAEALRQIKVNSSANATQDDVSSFSETVKALKKQPPDSVPAPILADPEAALLSASKFEDSDDWMYLTDQDLEDITASKTDPIRDTVAGSGEEDAFERLNSFTSRLDSFMSTRSDARGALFEDEADIDEVLSDDDLLFEDLDEEEQERFVQREVQARIQKTTPEERLQFLQTLIPHMTAKEWSAKPNTSQSRQPDGSKITADVLPNRDNAGFVSSIDQLAAERAAAKSGSQAASSQVAMLPNLSRAEVELQRKLASQYMREISSKMSTQPYEGASDSDSDDLEQETSPEIRRQLAKEYDLELDEEVDGPDAREDDADILDAPDLNDEDEIDNLLEFARTSLGLSKEHYEKILQDRAQQGKFVPSRSAQTASFSTGQTQSGETTATTSDPLCAKDGADLNTFESVMDEMDSRLADLQRSPKGSLPGASSKGKDVDTKLDDEEQELLSHLLKSGGDLPSSLWSGLVQEGAAGSSEDMIKAQQAADFLQSFQAQSFTSGPGASSGPVETLMRRFGLGSLPANADTHSTGPE